MKQMNFFKNKIKLEFGGSLLKGRRKTARPISTSKPTHLVLKATSSHLLLRHQKEIRRLIERLNKRFGVEQHGIGVHADHIHMAVRFHSRHLYIKWIRALTSLMVRLISGLKFKLRPYTVILSSQRHFKAVLKYVKSNQDEGDFILGAHQRMEAWRLALSVPPVTKSALLHPLNSR